MEPDLLLNRHLALLVENLAFLPIRCENEIRDEPVDRLTRLCASRLLPDSWHRDSQSISVVLREIVARVEMH